MHAPHNAPPRPSVTPRSTSPLRPRHRPHYHGRPRRNPEDEVRVVMAHERHDAPATRWGMAEPDGPARERCPAPATPRGSVRTTLPTGGPHGHRTCHRGHPHAGAVARTLAGPPSPDAARDRGVPRGSALHL